MKALLVKEDGLIYAAEVPEEPKPFPPTRESNLSKDMDRYYQSILDYPKLLTSAKESAVLVSDQGQATSILLRNGFIIEDGQQGHKPGIYPIPGLQFEVKEELIGVASNVTPFGSASEFRKVAILKESKSKGMPSHWPVTSEEFEDDTESQEELWTEVWERVSDRFLLSHIKELMMYYTITRKP